MNRIALVSVPGAMAHYEALRRKYRADQRLSRTEAINRAMTDLWVDLLFPYHVYSNSNTPDGVIRWHVVTDLNDKNHGVVGQLWEFRGQHRERDAVRLSIVLRNQFIVGAQQDSDSFIFQWPGPGAAEKRSSLIALLNAQYPETETSE